VLGSNVVSVDEEDSSPPSDASDRLNSSTSSENTLREVSGTFYDKIRLLVLFSAVFIWFKTKRIFLKN